MAHEGSDLDDMGVAGDGRAPLTDLVNVEPPILNGMTSTEATYVGIAAFVLWLILGAFSPGWSASGSSFSALPLSVPW